MHSVARAFAWDFWRRQRLVVALVLGYLLALVLLVNVFPSGTFDPGAIAQLCIPLAFVLPHIIALFAHGDQADLVARESGYPRRAFTLPVRTSALVGWPMLLGGAAVALFWLTVAGLVLRAAGWAVPLLWPAVFLAALLAWVQTLAWCPFPFRFARILVAGPLLGGMAAGAILAPMFGVSQALLLAVSAGLIPAAYLTALAGVARARRGDLPSWGWPAFGQRTRRAGPCRPFASAAEALLWLEWQRRGFALPLMLGLVLPAHLALLDSITAPGSAVLGLVALVVDIALMSPVAGTFQGNSDPSSHKVAALPPFLAARPVRTAEIIAAKLRVAARTTALTWGLMVLALLAVLPFCTAGKVLVRGTRWLVETEGVKGWALVLLIALGLPLLTWKWLVNQFWAGLSGRRWILLAMALGIPVGVTVLALFSAWFVTHPDAQGSVLDAVPWAIGLALLLKLGAGALVGGLLLRRGLLGPRALTTFAVAWVAAAGGLTGLSFWLMPPEVYSPAVVAGAAILLVLPLVRLGLAPLALDWNRHR
jgi:hypothetical protein